MMFYCKICSKTFDTYFDVCRHALSEHQLPDYRREEIQRDLDKTDWTCNDCQFAGILIADPYDDSKPMQKYCAEGRIFDDGKPICKNFLPRGE